MLKIIMGLKGSGKTKDLVGLVCKAVSEGEGDVIVIEKDRKLTYDIPYQARLIDAGSYDVGTYEFFKGFISGIHAGNYDITHIFIDSLTKIIGRECDFETEKFLEWLNNFSQKNNIKFTITISDEESLMSEGIKKFF